MYKVYMYAGVIRKLLFGCALCRGDNPLAKAGTQGSTGNVRHNSRINTSLGCI